MKSPQFSVAYHIGLNVLLFFLLVLPYAEEAWRCFRARKLPRMTPVIPQRAQA